MIDGARLPSYAVITPVRDEARNFARTAESLIAQDHRPQQWVIVDDGSTDGTRELAARYAVEHAWITLVDSGEHRPERARGAPIVRAFERGRAVLRERPEIVVKLDGDLFLPAHYFAWVAHVFAEAPQAGIVGGVVFVPRNGRWQPDGRDPHNVSGAAKAYRTTCLEAIGGLPRSMGWDGIDEYGARALGWHVIVLSELSILHYGIRGGKQPSLRARWEEGKGSHFMGYRWRFLALRVAYRMFVERPPLVGGLALGAGYLAAAATRRPRASPAARAVLREEQRARLRGLLRRERNVARTVAPGGGPAYSATGRAPAPSDRPTVPDAP